MQQPLKNEQHPAFIPIRKVCEISGFSISSIKRKVSAGKFPSPVIRDGNVTRWDLAECLEWRQARLREREEWQHRSDTAEGRNK